MAKKPMAEYVFGPVASRRLGRSLGIDLVPPKTCSYDCIYCQVGRTTRLTVQRKEWVPAAEVLRQVFSRLEEIARPDFITFSGSGEPTLHSEIGNLIRQIKGTTDIPIAVLTNGSLLWRRDVRRDLLEADVVIPSLDAGGPNMFTRVNRPHPSITFDRMIGGLQAFRQEYPGQIWLEVFLLRGLTDEDQQIKEIATIVERVRPDRIQLNTVARPPAEKSALAVTAEEMARLSRLLGKEVEVVPGGTRSKERAEAGWSTENVLALIRRRPCTASDVAEGLNLDPRKTEEELERLAAQGRIVRRSQDGAVFYLLHT